MVTFGEHIARTRSAKGLRLEDVAKKISKPDGYSISVPYLSDLERNRRTPSKTLVQQLAFVLDLPEDLLYFSLGKLPPNIRGLQSTDERIVAALQAFRRTLTDSTEQPADM